MNRGIFTLLIFMLLGTRTIAQTGIHGSFLHFETITGRPTYNLVLGMDRDVSIRSGFAIDLNAGFSGSRVFSSFFLDDYSSTGNELVGYRRDNTNYKVGYKRYVSSFGLTLRSLYFLSENQRARIYVGPFIGFRYLRHSVKTDITVYEPSFSYDRTVYPSWGDPKWTNVVVPIGLRIGLRSSMPGFLGDLFVGLGYQAGSKEAELAPYLKDKDQLTPFFLQFGWSMGGGWRGKK